jgi:hypothetical protein
MSHFNLSYLYTNIIWKSGLRQRYRGSELRQRKSGQKQRKSAPTLQKREFGD